MMKKLLLSLVVLFTFAHVNAQCPSTATGNGFILSQSVRADNSVTINTGLGSSGGARYIALISDTNSFPNSLISYSGLQSPVANAVNAAVGSTVPASTNYSGRTGVMMFYSGTQSTANITVTGLNPNTQYYVRLIAYHFQQESGTFRHCFGDAYSTLLTVPVSLSCPSDATGTGFTLSHSSRLNNSVVINTGLGTTGGERYVGFISDAEDDFSENLIGYSALQSPVTSAVNGGYQAVVPASTDYTGRTGPMMFYSGVANTANVTVTGLDPDKVYFVRLMAYDFRPEAGTFRHCFANAYSPTEFIPSAGGGICPSVSRKDGFDFNVTAQTTTSVTVSHGLGTSGSSRYIGVLWTSSSVPYPALGGGSFATNGGVIAAVQNIQSGTITAATDYTGRSEPIIFYSDVASSATTTITGLTPGEHYYISFIGYHFENASGGGFNICFGSTFSDRYLVGGTCPINEDGSVSTSLTSSTSSTLTFSTSLGTSTADRYAVFISDSNSFSSSLLNASQVSGSGVIDAINTAIGSSVPVRTYYDVTGPMLIYSGESNSANITVENVNPVATTYYLTTIIYNVARETGTNNLRYCFGSVYSSPLTVGCDTSPGAPTALNLSTRSDNLLSIDSFSGATFGISGETGYVVKASTVNSFADLTSTTTLPTVDPDIKGNDQVVYVGTSSTPNSPVSGITDDVTYYFKVYPYSKCGDTYHFGSGFSNSIVACSEPTSSNIIQTVSLGSIETITDRQLTFDITQDASLADGAIVYFNTTNSFVVPSSSTPPTPNSIYGGSGQQLVAASSAANFSVSVTNLTEDTQYYVRVVPYNSCGGGHTPKSTGIDATGTTLYGSPNLVSNPLFGTITANSITLNSFTDLVPSGSGAGATGYVIKMNTSNSFTPYPTNSFPIANSVYGGSGEQTIYTGTSIAPQVTITGLSENVRYYFTIYAYFESQGQRVFQSTGYEFSKTTNLSIGPPNMLFYDRTVPVSSASFNLDATSDSPETIVYSLVDAGTTNVSLSGTNNQTVSIGNSQGTAIIRASQAFSGTSYTNGSIDMVLTVGKPLPNITHENYHDWGIFVTFFQDINPLVFSNSTGARTYELIPNPYVQLTGTAAKNVGFLTASRAFVIKATVAEDATYAQGVAYLAMAARQNGAAPALTYPISHFSTQINKTVEIPELVGSTSSTEPSTVPPITYTIFGSDPTGSSITGNVLTIGSTVGSFTLRASTVGNSSFLASTQDFTVTVTGNTSQSISFPTISSLTCGGTPTVTLSATASSGFPVTYTSSDPTIAQVSGSELTILKSGTVNITASQGGGNGYAAAPDIVQSYTVATGDFLGVVPTLSNRTSIEHFELPTLTYGQYFTGPGRTGTQLNPGHLITTSQTIYINNTNATTPSCTSESSFTVTITPGIEASGLHFNAPEGQANHDYVTVAHNPSLAFTTGFTFEAWIKLDNAARTTAGWSWSTFFNKGSTLGSGFQLAYLSDVSFSEGIYFWHPGIGNGLTAWAGILNSNQWYHIAVTVSPTEVILYLDGVNLNNQLNTGGASLDSNTNVLNIGGLPNANPNAYPFQGVMDEVRIWNVGRTATQLTDNRNKELRGDESGLVLYYNMNQGFLNINNSNITTLKDKTSYGNDGTFNQFAFFGPVSNFVQNSPSALQQLPAATPKIFLQGPYDVATNLMKDDLRSAGIIPTTSPYGDGATVNSNVFTVTGNNAIVDWVYVQLRNKSDITNIIATVPALIQRDGDVVGLDGTSPVEFNVPTDSYYMTIGHRNHIDIASNTTLSLSSTSTALDLTTLSNIRGGASAVKLLETGVYGIYGGDVDGSGSITTTDFFQAVGSSGVINSYNVNDLDLNGNVVTIDYFQFIGQSFGVLKQF